MLFTPSLIHNEKDGKAVFLRNSGVLGQAICLVPRSQCSFRRVELINKGRNAEKAVLLRLKKEALAPGNFFKIVPDKMGVRAGAWEFPKKGPSSNSRFLPESLAREPIKSGARLVECLEGFEGQIWHEENLVSSRWWPAKPAKKEWLAFLRAVETEVDVVNFELPSIESVPFRRDIPIWDVSRDRVEQILSPSMLLILGMSILSCFAVYLSSQIIHYGAEINRHNLKIESVSKETEIVISQRNQALRNMKYTKKFEGLGHKGGVIMALAQITEVIKESDLKLSWVRFIDGNMEVGLAADPKQGGFQTNIPIFVAKMEAKPALKNVSMALRNEKLLTINTEIDLALLGHVGPSEGQ